MATLPPEVQKLVENLFDGLSKLGLTVTASAKTDTPTNAELASMGVRPAGADPTQALVNIRLGWSAQADRRLFLPEEAAGRANSWPKVAAKFLAIGIPADMAEYGYLADLSEFQAVESFKDLSGYLSNYVGLSLHDKLLSDISQTGTASGGKKPTGGTA